MFAREGLKIQLFIKSNTSELHFKCHIVSLMLDSFVHKGAFLCRGMSTIFQKEDSNFLNKQGTVPS